MLDFPGPNRHHTTLHAIIFATAQHISPAAQTRLPAWTTFTTHLAHGRTTVLTYATFHTFIAVRLWYVFSVPLMPVGTLPAR